MRSRLPLRLDTSTVTRPPSTFSTTVRPTNASISPLTSVQRRSSTGSIGAESASGGGATAAFPDVLAAGTTAAGAGDTAPAPLAGAEVAAAAGVADPTGPGVAATDGAACAVPAGAGAGAGDLGVTAVGADRVGGGPAGAGGDATGVAGRGDGDERSPEHRDARKDASSRVH